MDPFQEAEMSKQLILVDENDKFVGSDSKLACHRVKNGAIPLHRAFSVFIFNSKKEILLQQRSSSKVTYPNYVTNACCSHPLYDLAVYKDTLQSMNLAVMRRLTFELGMSRTDASAVDLQYVTKIHYFNEGDGVWGEHEIDYIYVLHKDVHIRPNPMEVQRVWTVPRNEFNDFIRNQEYPLTPWFELIMKHWLFKIWDNLDDLKKIRDKEIHKFV